MVRVSRFQHTIAFSVTLASVFSTVVRVPPTMNDDWSTGVEDGGRWGWLEEEWERLAENNESPSRLAATMLVHPRNIAASYRVPALEGEGVRRGTRRKPNCHGRERNKNFRPGAGISTIEGRRTPWSTGDAFINFHPRRCRLPSRT